MIEAIGVCVAIVVISLVVTAIVALFMEYILPFFVEGWHRGVEKRRRQQAEKERHMFEITEDTRLFRATRGWGVAIGWHDFQGLRVEGFRSYGMRIPKPGDMFVSTLGSGRKALFWFRTFERPWRDPSDYFQSSMIPYDYVDELSEDDAAWYEEASKRYC